MDSNEQKTDEEVINGIKPDDLKKLQCAKQEYYRFIRAYVLKNSGQEEDAKNLFQEGLYVVIKQLQKGVVIQDIGKLLFVICKRLWLNELRKRERRQEETIDGKEISSEDSEEELNKELMLQAVELGLQELPEKKRQVIDLKYYKNLSMEEIADRLELKNANVAKSTKEKIMKELRERVIEIYKRLKRT